MNNLSSKKKLILSIILISILSFSSGAIFVTASTAIPPWTLNNPLPASGDFNVNVFPNGTYYFVSGDGQTYYSNTNAATVINYAIGNLTSGRTTQETVIINCNTTTSSTILVPDHTKIVLNAQVSLAASSNTWLLRTTSSEPYDIDISGGGWNGNCWSQTSGGGFNITGTGSTEMFYRNRVWIHDTHVWNTYDTALLINMTGGCRTIVNLDNARFAAYNAGYGINARTMTDFIWSNIDVAGPNTAVFMYGCEGASITGFRTDGALYLQGVSQVAITNFFIDTYDRNVSGITLYDSSTISITSGMIRADSNSGYNTNSGILLLDDDNRTRGNCISNIFIGRPNKSTVTQVFARGIYEDSSWGVAPNYNLYSNINAHDTTYGNIIAGANSYISNSFNSTGIAK